MFQFSYQLWRRIMYGFWLTVIVFSMLVLIIIYTYQFKDFDYYWEKYLHVSKKVCKQRDLGLELYDSDTGTLFVKLLTPTFFLIITIIQLHYFHKDFLLISDIHYRSSEYIADTTQLTTASNIPNDSTETHITIEHENEIECPKTLDLKSPNRRRTASPTSELGTPTTLKEEVESNRAEREFKAVKICLDNIFQDVQQWFTSISEILWRILEIHIIKVVLLSTFILAAYDVCAIHFFAFVVFVVVALPLPALQSFFSHCMSIWVAVLLLSKMIYQLNIVDNLNWRRNCSAVMFINSSTDFPFPFNTTIDNHDWIGFKRTLDLANYCKGYIGLILVLTIQAVVKIRQEVNRIQLNLPEPKTGIIFPEATRSTADDNLSRMFKIFSKLFFFTNLALSFVT
ncbi:piezo-type mechanosensitive ion channel component [Caerostris extrusa]|uniref:Piezo-type mechanosensitive ion channel component n=1 Tax=Caerostris extrusa TaxID=172846 RepID=A0AAV4T2Y5_CAEEX|nr:piezo-type mechanosensitive ion channel component [Caerostris extrusa]